jgi:hypothetical protein
MIGQQEREVTYIYCIAYDKMNSTSREKMSNGRNFVRTCEIANCLRRYVDILCTL